MHLFEGWHILTSAEKRRTIIELAISVAALGARPRDPRVLIPVVEDFQFAGFNREGVLRPAGTFILARDANFLYTIVAYMLPVLVLAARARSSGPQHPSLAAIGSFSAHTAWWSSSELPGRSGFFRFSTYLFLPQIILLGLMAERAPAPRLGSCWHACSHSTAYGSHSNVRPRAYLDFYGVLGPASMSRASGESQNFRYWLELA